ncbi:MAG TPA: adenylate/guanylate cyclase domain-containing protein [Pyrinomonadaceae bacterium]|jgi:Adenylate cyclase, family 3 (some proteins contain HAMP domain)|nr:adenylate/guanylate cyclase domain-containing protein [Pyrinomonadaceae bacterium]
MAQLKITDASGRQWQFSFVPQAVCTIGRAPDNTVVLDDPRASRYHAHIKHNDNGSYTIVDGAVINGQLRRSANKVFINGDAQVEQLLKNGDRVTIGASTLRFEQTPEERTTDVRYDDKPLGHTQLLISANDVMSTVLRSKDEIVATPAHDKMLDTLQRKANILTALYEMSKTLGSVFDLNAIFEKATDVIFRSTPADRVVALLVEPGQSGNPEDAELTPIAMRARDNKLEAHARRLSIGRTITRKVMKDRVALLSQDAASDEQFAGVDSIVSQGVRSTICAPLVADTRVHGALYADRLDPFAAFKPDDLELISAVAAQTAIAVENARAHERLAREEVARANYSRFLPEYVVKQMLENPDSFKLGGVNQTITILFADIRGFTRISEHAPPEKIVSLLNRYFSAMTDIIFAHGGTLDKYLGDGLMALFGAPTATPEDASNALNAAVAMQRRVLGINMELMNEGLPEIGVGIGLHTGEVTVGYIGSERRSEYTAIGDAVNTASRLESNAKGGDILISDATAKAAHSRYKLEPREAIMVKNRQQPVALWEVDWQRASGAW